MKIILLSALFSLSALGAVEKPSVYFVSPKEGETVSEKVTVKFGLKGMTIKPAGQELENKMAGHHHLIVDGAAIPEGQVVPKDEKNIHFGKGETETTVALTPGDHTLTMQFANAAHLSYGPAMSSTIHVHVKK